MKSHKRFVIVMVAWVFASACNGCLGCQSPVDRPGSKLPSSCETEPPTLDAQKLDVLFVIDNSGSMAEEQAGVARELTSFVSELRVAGGVAQDLQVGVITTSIYQHTLVNGVDHFDDCSTTGKYCTQSGRLQPVPDSSEDGGVILGTGTERMLTNNDPDLVEKFSRLVRVGIDGSGQETPFEAIRMAVTASSPLSTTPLAMGGNQGFMRDGARLLIVVLSDEDDCSEKFVRPSAVTIGDQPNIDYCTQQGASLTTVADYFDQYSKDIKDSQGNLKDIVYTAIAPVGIDTKAAMAIIDNNQLRNIDCPTSNGPGIRHRAMASLFDTSLDNLDSICKADYHDTLDNIANLAGVSQILELAGVPDPGVLKIEITRKDNTVQACTVANNGLTVEAPTDANPKSRVHFTGSCLRRRDDNGLTVSLLCAF